VATSDAEIAAYKTYPQGFPWVLRAPLPVVNFKGELASDSVRSPDIFWELEKFWRLWNSEKRLAVCLRRSNFEEFEWPNKKTAYILAGNRQQIVVTNFDPRPKEGS
jgi:hypothetical protein